MGGVPVVCVYGSLFGWSEYYLIPMMEVKARKKRELSAEPVGKIHRCIPRYIRAPLGEKHETSTAELDSIHTFLFTQVSNQSSSASVFSGKKTKKCSTKSQALSVAVAMQVRKRRIRAHLQQRVKICEDGGEEEVEVMEEKNEKEVEQEEEKEEEGKKKKSKIRE